jgi:hypothetical protein
MKYEFIYAIEIKNIMHEVVNSRHAKSSKWMMQLKAETSI